MTAVLEVWVTEPGDICQSDKNEWLISVVTAHNRVEVEETAQHGHWTCSGLSPGIYKVIAQRWFGKKLVKTAWAVAIVGCADCTCVHLYPIVSAKEPKLRTPSRKPGGTGDPGRNDDVPR